MNSLSRLKVGGSSLKVNGSPRVPSAIAKKSSPKVSGSSRVRSAKAKARSPQALSVYGNLFKARSQDSTELRKRQLTALKSKAPSVEPKIKSPKESGNPRVPSVETKIKSPKVSGSSRVASSKAKASSSKASSPKASSPKASGNSRVMTDIYVYNPFYKKDVPMYGYENCGIRRASVLDRMYSSSYPITFASKIKYCDVLPLNKINYILGPISYREYIWGNINICLFGDIHLIEEDCPNQIGTVTFAGFLKSLLTQRQDIFYDFFAELDYINVKDKHYQGRSNDDSVVNFNLVSNSFEECFKLDKRACPYENTRMHYIDYRTVNRNYSLTSPDYFTSGNEYSFVTIYARIYEDLVHGVYKDEDNDNEEYLNYPLFEFLSYSTQKFIDKDPKINKQLQNSYISKDIWDKFVNDYMEDLRAKKREKANLSLIDFLPIFSIIMDIYALGRMFRTFNITDTKRPQMPENIIIYVGNFHASVYNHFFINYLPLTQVPIRETVNIRRNNKSSCLYFSDENKRKSLLFN